MCGDKKRDIDFKENKREGQHEGGKMELACFMLLEAKATSISSVQCRFLDNTSTERLKLDTV